MIKVTLYEIQSWSIKGEINMIILWSKCYISLTTHFSILLKTLLLINVVNIVICRCVQEHVTSLSLRFLHVSSVNLYFLSFFVTLVDVTPSQVLWDDMCFFVNTNKIQLIDQLSLTQPGLPWWFLPLRRWSGSMGMETGRYHDKLCSVSQSNRTRE